MARIKTDYDVAIVGGGFAGLVAATTIAARGLRVAVLESKTRFGARPHTTGLLVKEAAEELDIPTALTRKIHGVRLYAPNLRYSDIHSGGYYFLATDTSSLLAWLAQRAAVLGVDLRTSAPFKSARVRSGAVEIEPLGITTRFVLGADGARSQVARTFNLGVNRRFLVGVEFSFPGNDSSDLLHCFPDSRLAPGYLGWMVPGVGVWQAGIAVNQGIKPDLLQFIRKIAPLFPFDPGDILEQRAGLIPCGGLVRPFASEHALLVGDAAGLVSPLTAGGIQRAFHFGRRAALAICDYLCDGGPHPGTAMQAQYPSFAVKRLMRKAMNLTPPNWLLNAMITTPAFAALARSVYFARRSTILSQGDAFAKPQASTAKMRMV